MLEDYAFLIQGLLDLYEASFDVQWLSWAIRLQGQQDTLFWDAAGGGYFSTSAGRPDILVRMKDDYDGAEPAPNSIAAMNLLRLWQLTDRKEWRDKADAVFGALAVRLKRSGSALPQLASAVDFGLSTPKQIVIAGDPDGADTRALVDLVRDRFIPNKIVLLADGGRTRRAREVAAVSRGHVASGTDGPPSTSARTTRAASRRAIRRPQRRCSIVDSQTPRYLLAGGALPNTSTIVAVTWPMFVKVCITPGCRLRTSPALTSTGDSPSLVTRSVPVTSVITRIRHVGVAMESANGSRLGKVAQHAKCRLVEHDHRRDTRIPVTGRALSDPLTERPGRPAGRRAA